MVDPSDDGGGGSNTSAHRRRDPLARIPTAVSRPPEATGLSAPDRVHRRAAGRSVHGRQRLVCARSSSRPGAQPPGIRDSPARSPALAEVLACPQPTRLLRTAASVRTHGPHRRSDAAVRALPGRPEPHRTAWQPVRAAVAGRRSRRGGCIGPASAIELAARKSKVVFVERGVQDCDVMTDAR
jgi:hypothetical protein